MRLQERFCGKTDPAFRAAPGAGRAHRRLRRLGHAGAVQLADRRAPRGAPRRRRVRRVAHVRGGPAWRDRKSTRLNSSHLVISYAVFCLKKKKKKTRYVDANTC